MQLDKVKVVEVLLVEHTKGRGTPDDICRRVIEFWTKKGEHLVTFDPADKTIIMPSFVRQYDTGF